MNHRFFSWMMFFQSSTEKDRQSFYAFYAAHWLTQAFKEVIYEESRKISAGEYD